MTSTPSEERAPAQRARRRAEAQRRLLMEAEIERVALELFIEHGYRQVSVEQIAAATGVSARTFYRYFRAKEDVLGVLPRRFTRATQEQMFLQPTELPPFEALSASMLAVLRDADTDELTRWLAVTTTPDSPWGTTLTTNLDEAHGVMPGLVLRHMAPSPDVQRNLQLILGATRLALNHAATEWHQQGGDLVAITREMLDTFARGLATID